MWWEIFGYMALLMIAIIFIAGLWALFAPQSFLCLNRLCSTWVDTGNLETRLSDGSRSLDRLIYRHHFLSGFLLVAASLCLLYLVLFYFAGKSGSVRAQLVSAEWSYVLYEFMLGFACLAGITGMIIGMIVFIRPSSLKLVESWGNRSISVQPVFERLERRFAVVDVWVERHTRLFGGVVLILSVVMALLIWG